MGKLKIFLGYAAGTGKTYAMLEAAQDLKKHGIEVVAGYVEPHARPETSALLEGLETIPFLTVDYKGIKIREFDLDAALKRAPKVLLVDELAHTNAPGSRHQKRYQDIEELLEHGVNVYTTLNIQHLESLNDIVGRITNTQVRERIPDRIFDEADQVKLVDIEPEELIERMREGKIYGEIQARRALQNFFTREKLVALREIALRRMADRVNHLAERERKAMGTGEFSAGEHVLVCISPSPTNAKVIRTAARLAYAFHADFTALYVENRELQNMDLKEKNRRNENMRLARTLGAKVVTVYGEDVPRQIAEYARIGNVTKLVMGRTNHRIILGQKKGTLVDGINQYAPNLDVYIIPDLKQESDRGGRRLTKQNTATALTGGYLIPILLSVCAILLFDYFFTELRFSLKTYGHNYPVIFAMMLLVGLLSSYMMRKLQRQNEENARRAYRTEILLTNSRKLRRAHTPEAVSNEIASQIQRLVSFTVIVYLKQGEQIRPPKVYLRKGTCENRQDELRLAYTAGTERAVAAWVFGNGRRAGCTTHTLPEAQAIYLPVMGEGESVVAVVGLVLEERREINTTEYDIIMAMLDEAGLVLERIAS